VLPNVAMTFIYKVNGVDTEFSEDDLMNLPDGASLLTEKTKLLLKDTYLLFMILR
jgi:hypothetical protein